MTLSMQVRWLFLGAQALFPTFAQTPPKSADVVNAQPVGAQNPAAEHTSSDVNPAEISQRLSGRLFYTREQRERMDRARARGDAIPGTTDVAPTPSTLNGFVKRSDGQTMIWVDGQPRYNSTSRELAKLSPQDVGGSSERIQLISREVNISNKTLSKRHELTAKKASSRVGKSKVKPHRRGPPSKL